jgi:hypothetical protein
MPNDQFLMPNQGAISKAKGPGDPLLGHSDFVLGH